MDTVLPSTTLRVRPSQRQPAGACSWTWRPVRRVRGCRTAWGRRGGGLGVGVLWGGGGGGGGGGRRARGRGAGGGGRGGGGESSGERKSETVTRGEKRRSRKVTPSSRRAWRTWSAGRRSAKGSPGARASCCCSRRAWR